MTIAILDVMARVGHANYETTMLHTHNQGQTIQALDKFIDRNHFRFEALKV